MLKTSNNGIQLIKTFEGERLVAYQDSVGVWTIGVGHTGLVDGKFICKGMTITSQKSSELLKEDIEIFENAVNKLNFPFNQNQFDALVSFSFNCGVESLKTLVKNRNLQQIGDALLLYNKAGGKVLQGLVTRRKKERELYFTPIKQEVKTPVEAIYILNQKGIIKEPDKWYDGTWNDIDFKWLIIKFSACISGKEVNKPADAISIMVEKGIIVEPNKWYNGTWVDNDFKCLLIKMANYLL